MAKKPNFLAQMRCLSSADTHALALAALVLFDQISAGRLVIADSADDSRITPESLAQTIALLDTGDLIQEAIWSSDRESLPILVDAFASIADGEVSDE